MNNNKEISPIQLDTLRVADRCDRCGAQAYVSAQLVGHQPLLFCGHHYRKYEAKLAEAGAAIIDERWKLDAIEVDRKKTGVSA